MRAEQIIAPAFVASFPRQSIRTTSELKQQCRKKTKSSSVFYERSSERKTSTNLSSSSFREGSSFDGGSWGLSVLEERWHSSRLQFSVPVTDAEIKLQKAIHLVAVGVKMFRAQSCGARRFPHITPNCSLPLLAQGAFSRESMKRDAAVVPGAVRTADGTAPVSAAHCAGKGNLKAIELIAKNLTHARTSRNNRTSLPSIDVISRATTHVANADSPVGIDSKHVI